MSLQPDKKELRALEVARSQKYDTVTYGGSWNGMEIYVAELNEWNNESYACIGYPAYIIIDHSDTARMASSDEVFSILGLRSTSIDRETL